MVGDSPLCCLPIDIAVRLIGTISLLTNALVFIALVSDSDDDLTDDKVRIIFGFDSRLFVKNIQPDTNLAWFPIFCLVYTLLAAISSALLIWSSIIAQRWFTVPWLISSFFSIICHFTSLVMFSFTHLSSADKWVTAFTVFYSVILLYFTFVVTAGHYLWWIQTREQCRYHEREEVWENIYRSPPLLESPYKNLV